MKEAIIKSGYYYIGGNVYVCGASETILLERRDGNFVTLQTEEEVKDKKHLKELMK